jgi:NitT/TauT family transport system permease protein
MQDRTAPTDAPPPPEQPGGRLRARALTLLAQAGLVVVWLGSWEWVAVNDILPAAFIGRPTEFLEDFVEYMLDGSFIVATLITLQATAVAFIVGSCAALLTALAMSAFPAIDRLLEPIVDALNALPRVALIPLFIIWFGLGLVQKVASGVSIMYFILLSYTLAGAKSADPDHLMLARSLGIPRWRVFFQIVIPSAVPAIFAGLRLGLIYTVLGVITAELLAGGKGLGTLVSFYSNTFDPNGVFATLIVLVIVTTALSAGMSMVERTLGRWR